MLRTTLTQAEADALFAKAQHVRSLNLELDEALQEAASMLVLEDASVTERDEAQDVVMDVMLVTATMNKQEMLAGLKLSVEG